MVSWKVSFVIGVLLIIAANFFIYFYENYSTDTEDVEYFWDFGDGVTSTDTNPLHTFESAGKYKVTLTIRNGTNVTINKFVIDATENMTYNTSSIPITIEGISS